MNTFLTADELIELTGKRQPAAQRKMSSMDGPRFPAVDDIPGNATYLFGGKLAELFGVGSVEEACAYMDRMGVTYCRLRDGRIYTTPWHLLLHHFPTWTNQAGPLYPFDGFELSLEEIKALPTTSTHNCGVYFLFDGGELVYIGKSTEIETRLAAHRKSGKRWEEVRILDTARVCAEHVETFLIRQHLPPWNSRVW